MNVLHRIRSLVGTTQTASPRRTKKQVIDLQRTTDALIRRDLHDWRTAWQMAIRVDNPDRRRLYDIYRDVDVDLHLSGCVEQRTGFVMARGFKLADAEGNGHPEAAHYLEQEWFKQLMRHCLESKYWGHSLVELGDLTTDGDGCLCYDGVRLLPRKHVIPEYHRLLPQQGMDWRTGIDYHEPAFSAWLIECGRPDDLGLYLKAATHTIPKKHMLSFWDAFGEIFGMPMRVARISSRDPKDVARTQQMLDAMSNAFSAVLDQDTEVQFVESSRGDAYNVYDRRIERANSELSKLVIGQTMTIEDGSSLSQSQTHLEVFQNLVDADADMLRDVVNNQLLPRMVRHGFPLQGLRFEWNDAVSYTPEQQVAFERMLLERFELEPAYFEEKYGVKILGQRQGAMPAAGGTLSATTTGGRPFFD